MDEPAIRIEYLSKTYAGKGAEPKRALNDVSFDVPRGQIFGLLGPNGAGKSTLINILAGLVVKSGGRRRIWGFDIDEHPRNAKRSIGVVPQEIIFDPFFTPRETLEIQAGLYGIPPGRAEERRAARGDAPDRQGQCLFAHLVGRDEAAAAGRQGDGPFAADPGARRADRRRRRRASPAAVGLCPRASMPQGVTIVLTTHYLEEAEELCDRIAIINHGQLIANEPTRELVGKAQEKAVVVTFDRDIAQVPTNACFEKIALLDERTLEITYRKDKVNAGAGARCAARRRGSASSTCRRASPTSRTCS